MNALSPILSMIVSYKKNKKRFCIHMSKNYEETTLKNFGSLFITDKNLNEISKIILIWPDTEQDHTNRIKWMMSEKATYTDIRRYYFKYCDYYGHTNITNCGIKILTVYDEYFIDVINNTITKNSYLTKDIMFNSVDLACLSESESINIDDLEDLIKYIDNIGDIGDIGDINNSVI